MIKTVLAVLFAVLLNVPTEDKQGTEADYLREQFAKQVGGVCLSESYKEIIFSQVGAALDSNKVMESPQYLLFVDRNPSVQIATLLFVDPSDNCMTVIGADKVSTGNSARRGYFVTPLGFIKNSPANMSYRALGTRNSKGWRGLGLRGSRVWDFGWVETHTIKGKPYRIRLLLHATDPSYGEIRLGEVGSKGCIRISGKFNRFLDHFGILDAEYEYATSSKVRRVLSPEREIVCFPGRFVLVGDSGKK